MGRVWLVPNSSVKYSKPIFTPGLWLTVAMKNFCKKCGFGHSLKEQKGLGPLRGSSLVV
jgi:hypothetical protein